MELTKRTLSTTEEKILKNDLLDVQEWVTGALDGKINNCKKRLLREWQTRLLADPTVQSVPGDEPGLIGYITRRADYQNRYQREELIDSDTA